MTVTVRLIATAASMVALAVVVGAAPPQPGDAKVAGVFDRLEQNLLRTLSVADVLGPGREELVVLMRKYPRSARSWQLSPALASDMAPDDVVRFVTRRADSALACGVAYMSQVDLSTSADEGASPVEAQRVLAQFWNGPPREGRLRLDPGCARFVDDDGQPQTLSTRSDLEAFDKLMARFQPAAVRALRDRVDSPRLKGNLDYLHREFGGAPDREPQMEAVLGYTKQQVFSRQVLTLRAFVTTSGETTKVILLVPLSV